MLDTWLTAREVAAHTGAHLWAIRGWCRRVLSVGGGAIKVGGRWLIKPEVADVLTIEEAQSVMTSLSLAMVTVTGEDGIPRKRCYRKAHEGVPWVPVAEFGRDAQQPDGLNRTCKACWARINTRARKGT